MLGAFQGHGEAAQLVVVKAGDSILVFSESNHQDVVTTGGYGKTRPFLVMLATFVRPIILIFPNRDGDIAHRRVGGADN